MMAASEKAITLASMTLEWKRACKPAFGFCGTYFRIGSCSDMHCPQTHGYPKKPTMRDVYEARHRQKDRLRKERRFTGRCVLPSEPDREDKDWTRCTFCGRYELWYSTADHKCDVKTRLPENVVRDVGHCLISLPGHFLATRFGSPAQVWVLDRPYLFKVGPFDHHLRHYRSRLPAKCFRGSGGTRQYYVRIFTGSSFETIVTEKQFEAEFTKLPANLEPNGYGGVCKIKGHK